MRLLDGKPSSRSLVRSVAERREEQRLFARFHHDGDLAARAELIEHALPLARRLARRYERSGESLDDLVQVASLALVKAIDRFDPDRGDAFSSFAVPTILGELKRYFRDTTWAAHVPRSLQERVLVINAAAEGLTHELGRPPTPEQIALKLDLGLELVLEAIGADAAYNATSLDRPAREDDYGGGTIADQLGDTDPRFVLVEQRVSIRRGIEALPERERKLLYLHFAKGLTQSEIGEETGISQMHVSRLIRRAINRVRSISGAE
jgi:RNA polymerase sigma-B factor